MQDSKTRISNKKILLIEDSEKDSELILLILSEMDLAHHIIVLNDGVEALDYLLKKGQFSQEINDLPNLIILDLKMPKIDGFEVLKEIKQNQTLRNIPVVIFSSSKQEIDIMHAYTDGANAYVVKSINFEEFSYAIKEIISFWLFVNVTSIDFMKLTK
ncbi:MAG: response regulator [Candidatus Heimdallarchaeota archaeon]|nr:response regulator [Candidatus Heimdallarchaeota archaeon]